MPIALQNHHALLNSYNVAQLQFALGSDTKCDPVSFLHDLSVSPSASPAVMCVPQSPSIPAPSPPDPAHFHIRRMSSDAASTADTDSSVLSRPEKRPLSPPDDPSPKKQRHLDWDDSITTKVQLPSIFTTFDDPYRLDARRASLPTLHSESRVRHAPYPPTGLRNSYASSNLSAYTFPPSNDDDKRPRLATDLSFAYDSSFPSGLSNGTTPSSSNFSSSSTFTSPSDYHRSAYPDTDSWSTSPAAIVRPNSTPGQLSTPAVKYEDSLRHASFSAPMSQAQMYAGSARISGQHDRRSLSAGIKTEWSFPNSDFLLPSASASYSPSMPSAPPIAVSNSPRSPHSVPNSSLVDRPQRKRGKLPKETTDYLKSWLHRHSDHPYPSEEEKKQLCHATGLSMSQVSNWMINARRRILAPAHRAASGPTTTAPFPPSGRSLSGLLDPAARRSSMPADSLQLYHPMTLQSMPNSSSDYIGSTRHVLSLPQGRSLHHLASGAGFDYPQSRHMGLYAPAQASHSAGPAHSSHYGMSSDVPLSAPPSLSGNPFSSSSQHHTGQNIYPSFNPSSRLSGPSQPEHQHQHQYYNDHGHSHSAPAPGSSYSTPQ